MNETTQKIALCWAFAYLLLAGAAIYAQSRDIDPLWDFLSSLFVSLAVLCGFFSAKTVITGRGGEDE